MTGSPREARTARKSRVPGISAEALETTKASARLTLTSEEILKERTESASATETAEVEATERICATCTSAAAKALELLRLLPLLTILVVLLPLLRIADYIVSLLQSLELSLRLRIIRVQVGMKLLGALQVRLLHILLRYRLVDA